MSASLVLDRQMDLLARLEDQTFRKVVGTALVAQSVLPDRKQAEHLAALSVDRMNNHLRAAYAYRVTEDMCTLVEHAADGLDDLDRFDASLAPTGCGIVNFARGLRVHDIRGKTMLIHWIVWGPAPGGTLVWFFNDVGIGPDDVDVYFTEEFREKDPETLAKYQRISGPWRTVGASIFSSEARMGPARWVPSEEQAAQVRDEGFEPDAGTNTMRFVHALWLMMNQTIARTEEEVAERPARRRAAKARIPGRVTVIKLRREATPPGHEDSSIEWHHRWVVRGHWAWRHCREDHPGAVRYKDGWGVRVWVNPYVKGPEGKPFVQTEKVYSLER